MKKLVALALSLVMLISAASTALAYSPEDPITIPFWHTRGSGANYEVLKASVDAFNETVGKEKGIIVEEIYQGNYNTNVTKIQLGSSPAISRSSPSPLPRTPPCCWTTT
ncbi:MAG: hypothetical protein V8Q82_02970 [Christensenellales bacterium]